LYEKPVSVEMPIELPEKAGVSTRNYVITLNGALRLPGMGKKGLPPSSYCTISAANDTMTAIPLKGLSTNELKTQVIPYNSEPQWERRFEIPADLCNEAAGFVIKAFDSAAGVLRHRPIGNVFVPIGCFVTNTEANFRLPVDPPE
jgi:hypothetical protein